MLPASPHPHPLREAPVDEPAELKRNFGPASSPPLVPSPRTAAGPAHGRRRPRTLLANSLDTHAPPSGVVSKPDRR